MLAPRDYYKQQCDGRVLILYLCLPMCDCVWKYIYIPMKFEILVNTLISPWVVWVDRLLIVWATRIATIAVNERHFLIFLQIELLMAGLTRDNKLYLAVGSHNVYNKTKQVKNWGLSWFIGSFSSSSASKRWRHDDTASLSWLDIELDQFTMLIHFDDAHSLLPIR